MALQVFKAFHEIEDAADKMMTRLEQEFDSNSFWFGLISEEVTAWVSYHCAILRQKNIDKSVF